MAGQILGDCEGVFVISDIPSHCQKCLHYSSKLTGGTHTGSGHILKPGKSLIRSCEMESKQLLKLDASDSDEFKEFELPPARARRPRMRYDKRFCTRLGRLFFVTFIFLVDNHSFKF